MLALASATRGERRHRRGPARGGVGRARPPGLALPRRRHRRGDDARSVESVNSRLGNLMAIVGGDYLLARSAEIAACLGTEIAGLLATTLGLLCHGQVAEVKTAFSINAHRRGLPRSHRGQDRRAHGHRRAGSAPSPAAPPARGRGPHRVRPQLRDGVPAPRRRPRCRRAPTASSASRPARTWPRASTRFRSSSALADPESAPSWRRCSASRSACPSETRPGRWSPRSSGIAATLALGPRLQARADEAARRAGAPASSPTRSAPSTRRSSTTYPARASLLRARGAASGTR